MKPSVALTITSVLSILFFTFHLADDIVLGIEKGDISNLGLFPIAVVWLYGTVMLSGRRSGYIIMLLGAILGSGIPVIHMMGGGIGLGGSIAKYSGHWFFVWTLIALGVTALFSLVLAAQGLWTLMRSPKTETR